MKLRHILGATALVALPVGASFAQDLPPCENCADELTVMSWGGAYQESQQKAYSEPYSELTGVTFTWDESSAEAPAKMRAMAEAGNITIDLVDATISDAIRMCDEGLAIEIDPDEDLAPGDDGTSASEDFGDLLPLSIRRTCLEEN